MAMTVRLRIVIVRSAAATAPVGKGTGRVLGGAQAGGPLAAQAAVLLAAQAAVPLAAQAAVPPAAQAAAPLRHRRRGAPGTEMPTIGVGTQARGGVAAGIAVRGTAALAGTAGTATAGIAETAARAGVGEARAEKEKVAISGVSYTS